MHVRKRLRRDARLHRFRPHLRQQTVAETQGGAARKRRLLAFLLAAALLPAASAGMQATRDSTSSFLGGTKQAPAMPTAATPCPPPLPPSVTESCWRGTRWTNFLGSYTVRVCEVTVNGKRYATREMGKYA
ncbi:MAG: hypothetical protein OXU61_04160 [Gammaproteobacteria bacterium]|nr:hypothetical protein [Gammaproteobacteria bacterium]